MKIFIPYKVRDTGGSSAFAKKFKKGLQENGHEVFFDFQKDYDVLFVIVQCSPLYLLHAKIHKKKIIHRLDGVYYWSVARWRYPLLNLAPKLIHKFFSDFTVYQSKYSKYCAEKFLGKRKDKKYTTIYNGVDTKLFSPEGEKINFKDNPDQKLFITVSKFRREDQIMPIIKALKVYAKEYDNNFKLLVIGDFSNKKVASIPPRFKGFTQIKFLGKIKNEDLPKFERSADVFLFSHLNPPCPNIIIEAMACGLPICGVSDGAMKEITIPGENSLLAESKGDAFWKEREYDYEKFAENMDIIIKNKDFYSKNSRKIVKKRFLLDDMVNNYLRLF